MSYGAAVLGMRRPVFETRPIVRVGLLRDVRLPSQRTALPIPRLRRPLRPRNRRDAQVAVVALAPLLRVRHRRFRRRSQIRRLLALNLVGEQPRPRARLVAERRRLVVRRRHRRREVDGAAQLAPLRLRQRRLELVDPLVAHLRVAELGQPRRPAVAVFADPIDVATSFCTLGLGYDAVNVDVARRGEARRRLRRREVEVRLAAEALGRQVLQPAVGEPRRGGAGAERRFIGHERARGRDDALGGAAGGEARLARRHERDGAAHVRALRVVLAREDAVRRAQPARLLRRRAVRREHAARAARPVGLAVPRPVGLELRRLPQVGAVDPVRRELRRRARLPLRPRARLVQDVVEAAVVGAHQHLVVGQDRLAPRVAAEGGHRHGAAVVRHGGRGSVARPVRAWGAPARGGAQ